ncbi:mucin-2-like isoform X2 [Scylla paramamosain]|uniref:mucin-2-like isoform X2 n=1 Tax=Scylla paramamosain TaxID=85552 RepID=UPI003082A296
MYMILVDGELQEEEIVFFWNVIPEKPQEQKYNVSHKVQELACRVEEHDRDWRPYPYERKTLFLRYGPHQNVTVRVQIGVTVGLRSILTPSEAPTVRVFLSCSRGKCDVTGNDCRNYNGDNFQIKFSIETPSGIQTYFENVTEDNTASLYWDVAGLLPFTTYRVTALPVNIIGEASSEFLQSTTFKTPPEAPSMVYNLQATDVFHDSVTVSWTPPHDFPPKGMLEHYLMKWWYSENIGSINAIVLQQTNHIITDLLPGASYVIQVSAKNYGVSSYGEASNITVTTKTTTTSTTTTTTTTATTSTTTTTTTTATTSTTTTTIPTTNTTTSPTTDIPTTPPTNDLTTPTTNITTITPTTNTITIPTTNTTTSPTIDIPTTPTTNDLTTPTTNITTTTTPTNTITIPTTNTTTSPTTDIPTSPTTNDLTTPTTNITTTTPTTNTITIPTTNTTTSPTTDIPTSPTTNDLTTPTTNITTTTPTTNTITIPTTNTTTSPTTDIPTTPTTNDLTTPTTNITTTTPTTNTITIPITNITTTPTTDIPTAPTTNDLTTPTTNITTTTPTTNTITIPITNITTTPTTDIPTAPTTNDLTTPTTNITTTTLTTNTITIPTTNTTTPMTTSATTGILTSTAAFWDVVPPVTDLSITTEQGTKTLNLTWKSPETDTSVFYMVSLYLENSVILETNTSSTTASFEDLAAATQYLARVKACYTEEKWKCSNDTEITSWTWPNPPQLQGAAEFLNTTSKGITVKLPVLVNPPGWHWVLAKKHIKKRSQTWKEIIKQKAEEIVRRKAKNMENVTSYSYSGDPLDDKDLRVVARINEREEKRQDQMTIAEDSPDANVTLTSNTKYVVLVVTETRAGKCGEYHVSEPMIFQTEPEVDPVSAMAMIGGICIGAVLLATGATWVWLWGRKRRQERSSSHLTTTVAEDKELNLQSVNLSGFQGSSAQASEQHTDEHMDDLYEAISDERDEGSPDATEHEGSPYAAEHEGSPNATKREGSPNTTEPHLYERLSHQYEAITKL